MLFFITRFPSLSSFAKKQLEIEKTKPTFVTSVLKVEITKVGLVFTISRFFINKTAQGRKSVHEKIYLSEIT